MIISLAVIRFLCKIYLQSLYETAMLARALLWQVFNPTLHLK